MGKLVVGKDIAFLKTNDNLARDILIPKKRLKKGQTDDKAVVKIVSWPNEEHTNMIGEVVDILGKCGDNDVEMNTILAQYGLPYRYPKAVEDAADKITGEITKQDEAEREDFRNTWTCTIDPKDAKDFDDALSIKRLDNGLWEVGVHIADVSHYVHEGDIIDREAERRATSIYLVAARTAVQLRLLAAPRRRQALLQRGLQPRRRRHGKRLPHRAYHHPV